MAGSGKGKSLGRESDFASRLLIWYLKNGRHDLPWRQTRDPWLTLIAPVLLRKTTGEQVSEVYEIFVSRYPDPLTLAAGSEEEVEAIIRPLGLERQRARGLIALAKAVTKAYDGSVPSTLAELKTLPLVGDYSAREVLCVAFGRDEPMLDRNMIRVLQRVFSYSSSKKRPHTDPILWKAAGRVVPKGRAREYNYGIMDFAHSVCRARAPLCLQCPMSDICDFVRTAK